LTKKRLTSSKAAAEALASQQHMPVCEFLNHEPTRTELLAGLIEKRGEGNELTLLEALLKKEGPISGQDMMIDKGMTKTTVSGAAKELNEYLTKKFSKSIKPLKAKRVLICIPRRKGRGGLFVGYHFACFNTKTKKYLDGPATRNLFEELWNNFIEDRLRKTLEEDARSSLSERLKDRDDYQPLGIEIGFIKENLQQPRFDESPMVQQPKAYDHNRVWKPFNIDFLLESGGNYIVSVDTGRGKTTFLRNLQTKFLQKTGLIPIFLDASEIERWKLEDTHGLAEKLAEKIKLKVQKDKVTDFLTQAIGKDIILLVDGLDQIRGGGNEYERLSNHILDDLAKNNLIITSRPSAVINLEHEQKFTFLRLKPFNADAQEKYFGEHYKRASELSVNAPDLVAIPMLAYMVRSLIEEKRDKHINTRTQLYGEFINYILTKYKYGQSRLAPDARTQIRQSLRKISYDALANKEPHIQKIPLMFCYEEGRLPDEPTGRKGEFLTKSGLVNLILERSVGGDEDFLLFTHQSFQEYLAAEYAHRNKKLMKQILVEIWDPKWKEVIKFLAGLEQEHFVKKIYWPECKDNCIHSRLFLAAECSGELRKITQTHEQLLRQLTALIAAPAFHKSAIFAIGQLNSSKAVDLLVDVFSNSSKYCPASTKDQVEVLAAIAIRDQDWKYLLSAQNDIIQLLASDNQPLCNVFSSRLTRFSAYLTTDKIDKVVELAVRNEFMFVRCFGILYDISTKLQASNLNNICSLLKNRKIEVKKRALRLLSVQLLKDSTKAGRKYIDEVIHLLRDNNKEIRQIAAHTLVTLADKYVFQPAEIRQISDFLSDVNVIFQEVALYVLAGVLDKPSEQHFSKINTFLATENLHLRQVALDAIRLMLSRGILDVESKLIDISTVIDALKSSDAGLQAKAADTLAPFRNNLENKHVEKIIDSLPYIRQELQNIPLPVTLSGNQIRKLIERLDCDDEYVRTNTLEALSWQNKQVLRNYVNKILGLLQSEEGKVVRKVLSILPKLPRLARQHLQMVVAVLQGYYSAEAELAGAYLSSIRLSPEYTNTIIEFLNHTEPRVQANALFALRHLPEIVPEKYITRVIELLASADQDVRAGASILLQTLQKIPSDVLLAKLIGYLKSKDPGLQVATLHLFSTSFLDLVSDREISEIIDCLHNPDLEVNWHVVGLLSQLRSKLASGHAKSIISYVDDPHKGARISNVLSFIPSEAIIPNLDEIVSLLGHQHILVRDEALRALRAVANELHPHHIIKIIDLLYKDPEGTVRYSAYCVLEKVYESGRLQVESSRDIG
jgi:HEAT repeat protein